MTLAFSRHMYVDLVFDQKVETWIRLHVRAFEYFGGVPRVLVPDNLKAAVVRAAFGVDDEAVLNRSYRELARHYGFQIDPAPPAAPEKKGKVERNVRYVRTSFLSTHDSVDIECDRTALWRWTSRWRRSGATARRAACRSSTSRPWSAPALLDLAGHALRARAVEAGARAPGRARAGGGRLLLGAVDARGQGGVGARGAGPGRDPRRRGRARRDARACPRGQRSTVERTCPSTAATCATGPSEHWLDQGAWRMGVEVRAPRRARSSPPTTCCYQLRKVQAVVRLLEGYPRERARARGSRRARRYGCLDYRRHQEHPRAGARSRAPARGAAGAAAG